MSLGRKQLNDLKLALQAMLTDIEDQNDLGSDAQKIVGLDQQAVGRLSRMDAIQQQAMANATAQRRAQISLRATAALRRMEVDSYGFCTDCGEDIALKRLKLDPTVAKCISCANG